MGKSRKLVLCKSLSNILFFIIQLFIDSPETINNSSSRSMNPTNESESCPRDQSTANHKGMASSSYSPGSYRYPTNPHNIPTSDDSGNESSINYRQKSNPHFVVVAIDFGTTYSGYAFAFTRDIDSILMMRKVDGNDPG